MPFTSAHGTCDCCGTPLDHLEDAWITAYGPFIYGFEVESEAVLFEWSPKGAYCPICLEKLVMGALGNLGLPDRYGREDEDDTIAHEIELIRGTE